MSLSSACYNNLGLGRWEELCHEFMSSVLPMDDPGMSVDDLPTWRIIFLKDDCFLQPSCEVTCSTATTTTATTSLFSSLTVSPSSTIEPLFEGIDLNQHHSDHRPRPTRPEETHPSSKRQHPSTKEPQPLPKKRRTKKTVASTAPTGKDDTIFQQLSLSGIDWCRYCGTTEGVNWRPGPWGKRTLCNKHGCDYKGYGLASRLPRLDLSRYRHEEIQDRHRPVIQEFCFYCQQRGEALMACDGGCSRAFHRLCMDQPQEQQGKFWYCGTSCAENRRKKRVVVDLPRKQPLMRLLK